MSSDPSGIEHLYGHWLNNPHLSTLDRLIFCEDGKGLLFVGMGDEEAPYIDEFSWAVEGDGSLRISWLVSHYPLDEDDGESEFCRFAIDVFPTRRSEKISVPVIDESTGRKTVKHFAFPPRPEKYLYVDLRYYLATDELWKYQGPAGTFSEEKAELEQYLSEFDPGEALAGMNEMKETADHKAIASARIHARLAENGPAGFVHEQDFPTEQPGE